MAILKCKMCGGEIELSADKTFGMCDSCGSTMTFPKVDDEQRANMFNRGNHFRRMGEFDKALAVYERIVQEDENDAEAHWCCALCRFGIEYVEDPNTFEYLPTCHRASFDSFLEDVDYLAALEHSDGVTRRQYQKDAAKIAEVQRGILATSQNEEPFDVFICYKESENDGTRTRDSLMAQDIYYQLTEQGRRVFFSRITLEDKAGTEYEPYIFAALNSAKVMIVVTTSAEHANAVWVKNEWSRFLSLMRKDRSKLLLPCYRDMDPYDLPEALSVLQSYDMSRIGFIQDLTRGVNKVLDASRSKESVKETVKETVVVQPQGKANVAPLLERAFMFLEDGDWNSANEYCEKVLDIDPKNAEAYLGKLMAELRVRTRDALKDQSEPFDGRNSCQKALRFGNETLKKKLISDVAFIKDRNETARKEGIYQNAVNVMSEANDAPAYMAAAKLFRSIPGYRDADALAEQCVESAKECDYTIAVNAMNKAIDERAFKKASELFKTVPGYRDADTLAEQCLDRAEACRKNEIYAVAKIRMQGDGEENYRAAISRFKTILGWKDADEQIKACEKRIEEIKAKEEAERIETERKAEEVRIAAEKRKKKNKKIALIVAIVLAAATAVLILLFTVIMPAIRSYQAKLLQDQEYEAAVALYNAGELERARNAFSQLIGYKDSSSYLNKCKKAINDQDYDAALALYNNGKYQEAMSSFRSLNGYKDSKEMIEKCQTGIKDQNYDAALELYYAGQYDKAIAAFEALNGYRDSTAKIKELNILKAKVGSYVFFGTYEQDNNASNGKEDIEWLVLAKEGTRALVISRYALDCQQYNSTDTDVTWETCSLRKWLNGTFISNAFSADEKVMIQSTIVTADKNPEYSTTPGNNTTDKVFLLSITEVNKYFSSDNARQCQGTAYCYAQGAYKASNGNCWWWLRSPGSKSRSAAVVRTDVSLFYYGNIVYGNRTAVRPALWIDLG